MNTTPVSGKPVPSMQEKVERVARKSWISSLLAFLQLGCAISLICIVRYELEHIVYTTIPPNYVVLEYTCFMSFNKGAWACQYAYAMGAVSMFLSIIIFIMQCVAIGDAPYTGARICEIVLDIFGAAWFLGGSIVLTNESSTADKANIARASARAGVLAMSWLSFALYMMLLVVNVALVIKMRKARRTPGGGEQIDVKGVQMAV